MDETAPPVALPEPEREAFEFFSRLVRLTPRTWVTYALVSVNLLVFGAMVLRGVSPLTPSIEDLRKWGAGSGTYVITGEWWRLVSSAFVHGGLLHIAVNLQHWDRTVADFRRVSDVTPEMLDYVQLHIWLARVRLGERNSATEDLKHYLGDRSKGGDDWPRRIGAFLVGDIPETQLFATAESPDERASTQRIGEACFYAGSKHLIEGDQETARRYFQRCLVPSFAPNFEYTTARTELEVLDRGR